MAGYRPKSLSELNDMYDKTITAEKAIIKATKQLHDEADKVAPLEFPQEEIPREEPKAIEELSDEVDSLINRFREETKLNAPVIKEPVAAKEPEPIAVPSQPEEIKEEAKAAPEATPEAAETVPVYTPVPAAPVRTKLHFSLDTGDELQKKATAKSDEKSDLFEDYMKIMNDEDDELFTSHESFRKKEKKKKHKKGLFFRHEPKEDAPSEEALYEEDSAALADTAEISPSAEASSDELPVKEVIYTPEVPLSDDSMKVMFSETPSSEQEIEGFVDNSLYTEKTEADSSTVYSLDEDDNEPSEELAQYPDFDIGEQADNEEPVVPEEIADKTYEDILNNSDDIYSFDPGKLSTLPEYAKDRYIPEEDNENDEDDEEVYEAEEDMEILEMPKNKKGVVAGRVILSLMLTVICIFTVALVGINSVLGVNTGNTAFGDKYIFTASQNYTNSNILEGDLIITEKRYANDGEVFAYINYTQQCFMFGKRNGSIVNDSGDVLFIAENDGERVLVLRDDTRGVVVNTYPSVGGILSICTDNFILLAAILLASALVIILLLAFVFKDKEKAYKKMMKKMIRKGVISAEEEADFEYSEDEAEPENLFSTIE